jgi:hypothetical protein
MRDRSGRYVGHVSFAARRVTIQMPNGIVWPAMTPRDNARVALALSALRQHEFGHIAIAEKAVADLNRQGEVYTATAAEYHSLIKSIGMQGLKYERDLQSSYDDQTRHGTLQQLAPGELAGPPATLRLQLNAVLIWAISL